MSITIIHKKSETPGASPSLDALAAGEFGVNGADGDVFFRILIDPFGEDVTGNRFVLSVRQPLSADGGVITVTTESTGTPFMLAEMLSSPYNYDWYNGF